MSTVTHRVYQQDHTGMGILRSEHEDRDEALAVATEGKRTSKPSLIRANIWYVASPRGTTGMWDITYIH